MVNFTLYFLSEDQLTITDTDTIPPSGVPDGTQLDGQNQGDGSHLDANTPNPGSPGAPSFITINTTNFEAIEIADPGGDTDFRDNDSGQTLNGAQTIAGVSYAGGTIVEAEYGITVEDPDGVQYTLLAVNIREPNSVYNNPYGSIEGLAFVAPLPPVGVALRVIDGYEGPNEQQADLYVPCFVAGTLVDVKGGKKAVENLQIGDLVKTRDHGFQRVNWIGQREVDGQAEFAPIVIKKGAMGNSVDLYVSPQHRILVTGWRATLLFGEDEVLVPAKALLNDKDILQHPQETVTYVHFMCAAHQIVCTDTVWSESFLPTELALNGFEQATRDEFFKLFPDFEAQQQDYVMARPEITVHEARALI